MTWVHKMLVRVKKMARVKVLAWVAWVVRVHKFLTWVKKTTCVEVLVRVMLYRFSLSYLIYFVLLLSKLTCE